MCRITNEAALSACLFLTRSRPCRGYLSFQTNLRPSSHVKGTLFQSATTWSPECNLLNRKLFKCMPRSAKPILHPWYCPLLTIYATFCQIVLEIQGFLSRCLFDFPMTKKSKPNPDSSDDRWESFWVPTAFSTLCFIKGKKIMSFDDKRIIRISFTSTQKHTTLFSFT